MAFPHHRSPSARSILRGQAVGFSVLLLIMWSAEIFRMPHHFFGAPEDIVWSRIALRSAVLLVIWGIVHLTTVRLLRRLHELENYLRICSWCRKVNDRDEWRTMEDYFDARFQTGTSHGICPACAQAQLNRQRTATRVPPAVAATKSD